MVRVALVGVGRMGSLHLKKCLADPRVELIGAYDPSRSGTSPEGVRFFAERAELFFEADAVIVASPTASHFLVAREALLAGLPVLIEKPMAETCAQASELLDLAADRRLHLQVGFVERFRWREFTRGIANFSPVCIHAQRFAVQPGRERDVDVIADLMMHDLDIVLSTFGEMPARVTAVGAKLVSPSWDIVSAHLEFASGKVAHLDVSRVAASPARALSAFGGEMQYQFNYLTGESSISELLNGEAVKRHFMLTEFDALTTQLTHFVNVIEGLEPPFVRGEDGLRALQVCDEIRKALREKTLPLSQERSRSFQVPLEF